MIVTGNVTTNIMVTTTGRASTGTGDVSPPLPTPNFFFVFMKEGVFCKKSTYIFRKPKKRPIHFMFSPS